MDSRVRFALEAIASHWLPRTAWILFAALLLAIAALGLTQNVYSWIGETPPKGINSIDVWKMGMVIGSAGTATAFLATLFVAQRNYLRSREHIPHLTMNLSVERVAISKTYDVIVASLEAQNTGRGLCTVKEVNWMVVAVSPYDDETVDLLVEEFEGETDRSQEEEFPWYTSLGTSSQGRPTHRTRGNRAVDAGFRDKIRNRGHHHIGIRRERLRSPNSLTDGTGEPYTDTPRS